jgi:hypothetical protein
MFTTRKKHYRKGGAGFGQIDEDCCTVTVLARRIAYEGVRAPFLFHPWLWVDKDCNDKVSDHEIYGYGPPGAYGPGQAHPVQPDDLTATIRGKFAGDDVYAAQLKCDCVCIAAWWESHFGWAPPKRPLTTRERLTRLPEDLIDVDPHAVGKQWCPSSYNARFFTWEVSIDAVKHAVDVCCDEMEQDLWTSFLPYNKPAMKKWRGREKL